MLTDIRALADPFLCALTNINTHHVLFLPVDANFMMLLEDMLDFELCDANFRYPLLPVLVTNISTFDFD
jgi:hypothetical protein